jgi:hypothetical protein
MPYLYRPDDRVVIRDGNVITSLIDDNHQKLAVDVPDGTEGTVRGAVFGGAVYLVRTTVVQESRRVSGTGLFAEGSLSRA